MYGCVYVCLCVCFVCRTEYVRMCACLREYACVRVRCVYLCVWVGGWVSMHAMGRRVWIHARALAPGPSHAPYMSVHTHVARLLRQRHRMSMHARHVPQQSSTYLGSVYKASLSPCSPPSLSPREPGNNGNVGTLLCLGGRSALRPTCRSLGVRILGPCCAMLCSSRPASLSSTCS